jgi:preprotein translocase subunit SecD
MTTDNDLDRIIRTWIAAEAAPAAPSDLARAVGEATSGRRRTRGWIARLDGLVRVRPARTAVALAAAILIVAGGLTLGQRLAPGGGPSPTAGPPAGFVEVFFKLLPAGGKTPDQAGVARTIAIISARARAAGLVNVSAVAAADAEIGVTVRETDADAVAALTETGLVQFYPLPPATYGSASTNPSGPTGVTQDQPLPADPSLVPLFDGSSITSATAAIDQNGQPVVDFELSSDAAAKFGTYTTNNVGNFFAIVLDGTVVSAPSINSAIPGGRGEINVGTGTSAQAEVNHLVAVLTYGALPFPISELLTQSGGPLSPAPTAP